MFFLETAQETGSQQLEITYSLDVTDHETKKSPLDFDSDHA